MPELPDINAIGQKALGLPVEIINTETRQLSEKVNIANARIQELGAGIPIIGQGLPSLPPLPMMAGFPELPGMSGQGQPAPTKQQDVKGVRTRKVTSYLER